MTDERILTATFNDSINPRLLQAAADLERDIYPDPGEYTVTIGGTEDRPTATGTAQQVMFLIGQVASHGLDSLISVEEVR